MNSKSKVVNDRQRLDATGIVTSNGAAYALGDAVGGLWTFPVALGSEGSGVIEQLTIIDLDDAKSPLDIVFFRDAPVSGFTDNAAVAIAAGDRTKVIGWMQVLASHYTSVSGSDAIATVTFPIPFTLTKGVRDLTAIAIARGTPTYTSTNALLASIIVRRD